MEFQKAVKTDVDSIMNIIRQAQSYFKEHGINQWQDNYPNLETINNDIKVGTGYILLKDDFIVGTVVVTFEVGKNYESIHNGGWIRNDEYVVIHRMAVNSNYKGLGLSSIIIKNIVKICLEKCIHSIRIDTHEENISMMKLLSKTGFQYCGIIYLDDKSKRLAFQKLL